MRICKDPLVKNKIRKDMQNWELDKDCD